jgi:putative phosphoribosyl transferase
MLRESESFLEAGALFADRARAGSALAARLDDFRDKDALVLGIARGGMVVAAVVARRLNAELDVVVARKLGAPSQPELAIGAVTASGGRILNQGLIDRLGVPAAYIGAVSEEQMEAARSREAGYRQGRPAIRIEGRIVILVDDGLATGTTMRAAARSIRRQLPALLVAAAPVGSKEACQIVRDQVDDLICPYTPTPFHSVGEFYEVFDPVQDAEVLDILREHAPVTSAAL